MKSNGDYEWKFSTIGGVTRVNISSGADIAHLEELDPKLWTVLSCPVDGLEIDGKTLSYIDTDADGRIRIDDVVAVSKWLSSVLSDMDLLLERKPEMPLAAFREDSAEGKALAESASQVLKSLRRKKETISLDDVTECLASFAGTRFNGDGVITENTPEEESLRKVIGEAVSTVGGVPDRSGDNGVNAELIEKFYASAADFCAWKEAGDAAPEETFPYGTATADALALCNRLAGKVEDWFLRCRLASFNENAAASLDVTADQIAAVSGKNLSACEDEISSFPLAGVRKDGLLPLVEGVNPAWSADIETFRTLVVGKLFPGSKTLSEAQWHEIKASFAGYSAWIGSEKGCEVASLGYDRLKTILADNQKDELLALVEKDKSLESKVSGYETLVKLLCLVRDFYTLLRNYVTFSDFYSSSTTGIPAAFQIGHLYIDQRSCDLCLKVADMGKHATGAALCGMFLIYCDCVSKHTPGVLQIVAVMTDGDISNLKVGKNAIFYDREGRDWDATVTKIVDNPISLRESFWSPYRKMGNFIEKQIAKFASEQDKKVTDKSLSGISSAGTALASSAPAAADAAAGKTAAAASKTSSSFDIAKFCGLFAVIGMALGTIGTFLVGILNSFLTLKWWQMPLVIIAILLIISGPAMLLDYLKIRRRNLSPLLNANGWAVNARLLVNVRFGTSLTHMAHTPLVVADDPFADKGIPAWKKALISAVVVLGVLVGVYFIIPADKRPRLKAKTEKTLAADSTAVQPVDSTKTFAAGAAAAE